MSVRGPPFRTTTSVFDTVALAITTVLTLVFVVLAEYGVPWILIPFGLFVLFVAPGYGAAAILFGRRPLPSLAVNVAVIVGLSVLINVVVGTLILFLAIAPLAPLVGALDALVCAGATTLQSRRPREAIPGEGRRRFRSFWELPGFTRGQRAGAYAFFVAILLTFAAIGYLSTLQPHQAPDLSLGVAGPDGTTSSLPSSGPVNGTLSVTVTIQNNATEQSMVLAVSTSLVGANATHATTVPWKMPLRFGPNETSSEGLQLASGATLSVPISFQFTSSGEYRVLFSLSPPQAASVRTASITVDIT